MLCPLALPYTQRLNFHHLSDLLSDGDWRTAAWLIGAGLTAVPPGQIQHLFYFIADRPGAQNRCHMFAGVKRLFDALGGMRWTAARHRVLLQWAETIQNEARRLPPGQARWLDMMVAEAKAAVV